jgi:hypothetical protein
MRPAFRVAGNVTLYVLCSLLDAPSPLLSTVLYLFLHVDAHLHESQALVIILIEKIYFLKEKVEQSQSYAAWKGG